MSADKANARYKTPKSRRLRIAALAGGVGASKLLLGLYDVMEPSDLTAIVNTGDDITLFKSLGCALEDLVTAQLIYDLASVHEPHA